MGLGLRGAGALHGFAAPPRGWGGPVSPHSSMAGASSQYIGYIQYIGYNKYLAYLRKYPICCIH